MVDRHLVSVNQFVSSGQIVELILVADGMKSLVLKHGGDNSLQHKVLALLFYEPSTRTSSSFQAAMQRLGGSVIQICPGNSSIQKGESIGDTVMTLSCYCDGIVMRHGDVGSLYIASQHCSKVLINAGDGVGEHPTQALLDLYTIQSELGCIGYQLPAKPMCCVIVGDLKHGRTVHSLVKLLMLFEGISIVLVSPPSLRLPSELLVQLHQSLQHDRVKETSALDEIIVGKADVLYMTRIQQERFTSADEYREVMGSYCLTAAVMTWAKEKMIVMHPLPRVGEIAVEVDTDPRAAYFRQMENGMYMRMALLQTMLSS